MTYKVEHIPEAALEGRLNALAAEGWSLVSIQPHHFNTVDAAPIYVTVWSRA